MKGKAIITIAVMAVIGFAAVSAWAGPWGGPRGQMWGGGGPGYCLNATPEGRQFYDETAELRSELAGKQGEYRALMYGGNPDPERAGQLQREMSGIQDELRTKARQYQDETGFTPYAGRGGYAPRGGRGGRGGHRMGPCW